MTQLYAHVLLDRSGSMTGSRQEAINAYNAYVEGLDTDARISLTIFDSIIGARLIRDYCSRDTAKITEDDYKPEGMTPLYDAIGITVAEASKRKAERTAFVILTDGLENCSREWKADQIRLLLKAKQEEDHWLVIYLGANQDAWAVGQKIGMNQAHTMDYGMQNVNSTMRSAARATASYASADSVVHGRSMANFTKDERDKAKK